MNRFFLFLFISGALFGLMALMPEGERAEKSSHLVQDFSQERTPSSIHSFQHNSSSPASGEPSDNGLTRSMHLQFRQALNRDPLSAIELATDYVFTRELDPEFRLEILRELKVYQFSHPGVSQLADEIISVKPDPGLYEEALTIKYATLGQEGFSELVAELERETDDPEYATLLERHAATATEIILSPPLSQTAEEPSSKIPELSEATASDSFSS